MIDESILINHLEKQVKLVEKDIETFNNLLFEKN